MNRSIHFLILFFYIFAPILFYGTPAIFIYINNINLDIHWYTDLSLSINNLVKILCIHVFVGLGLVALASQLENKTFSDQKRNNPLDLLFLNLLLLLQFFPLGALKFIAFLLIFCLLGRLKISSKVVLIFFFYGIAALFMLGDRELIVFSSVLLLIFFQANRLQITFLSILGFFALIFVLMPIREGISPIEFFNENQFIYTFLHLNSIYLGAGIFLNAELSFFDLLSEGIPFLKGMTESGSLVLAENYSKYISRIEADFGTNTSMYANLVGYSLCFLFLAVLLFFNLILPEFRRPFIFYLLFYGPSFIRRSFGSYFAELIIIFVIVFALKLTYQFLKNIYEANYWKKLKNN